MKLKLLITFIVISLQQSHSKIVFEPGSDMGYIVPDNDEIADYERDKEMFIENLHLKASSKEKRQLFNTIFDDVGGINEWDRIQEQEKLIRLGSMNDSEKEIPEELKDAKHGVKMGISDQRCDDAQTLLEMDWDGSPSSYTCYNPKHRLEVAWDKSSKETCDFVPEGYIPHHYCMKDPIRYNTSLPTFGPHRPLWPIFGEYKYVPIQRWLHSIEHGSVVMLYHPCTAPVLVNQLKKLVAGCIYKHVISAYTEVSLQRPMVLIAWGCKLEMAYVDEAAVKNFIRQRALKGPEGKLTKQGTYDVLLLKKSLPPPGSDREDSVLCP